MSKKNFEKSNRSNAAGTPFPLAYEQMQKLRYWYQSELTNSQLIILLILWIKGELGEVSALKKIPEYYRLKSSDVAKKNSFRILRDGNISWVEFSISMKNGDHIWMPIPFVFKELFLNVLRSSNYENSILTQVETSHLYQFWEKKMERPRKMRGISMAQKITWQNYFSNYCRADELVSANAKNQFLKQVQHRSADTYQTKQMNSIRFQLYRMLNSAINRLFIESEKWSLCSYFERDVNGHKIIPDRHVQSANYLISNAGSISEQKIIYHKHHREKQVEVSNRVGAKNAINHADVANFFIGLQKRLIDKKSGLLTISEFRIFYNELTNVFALQIIALTSSRPTHAISPKLASLKHDRFAIKDKGQSRNILLNCFLQEQITRYRLYQKKLKLYFPSISDSEYLLFYINEQCEIELLTAKSLRQYMNSQWAAHVPYQLRKVFAQTLMELNTPTFLIDRLMGHSLQGEHDGVMNVFPVEESRQLKFLNRLPAIFGVGLFDI